MPVPSSDSSVFSVESSSSRESTPEWNPAKVHEANTRRAIEAGDEPSHDFSIWSEDDKSLTDGESDLRFLVRREAVEESEDDCFPWDGVTSSEEVAEEEEEEDNEGPVGGRWSSDDEQAGSSADSSDAGDDEGSDGP